MLKDLLSNEIREKGISKREAARQIGVAHTTVNRIIKGVPPDLATIYAVANWMNMNPSVIVDLEASAELPNKVAAILSKNPKLAEVFEEAFQRVEDGRMDISEVEELVSYMVFRLEQT